MPFKRLAKNVSRIYREYRHRLRLIQKESVFFITLHKCASSLFESEVLPFANYHRMVDYNQKLYQGRAPKEFRFPKNGVVFGPIRVQAESFLPDYIRFFDFFTDEFLSERNCIFLVRDPRDILVSQYYSFGYSHSISSYSEVANAQETLRAEIQGLDIDQYVIHVANDLLRRFEVLVRMHDASNKAVLLRYEDLIDRPTDFLNAFGELCPLPQKIRENAIALSRPQRKEDATQHRRSGNVRGYVNKLSSETILSLDQVFGSVLSRLGYQNRQQNVA